MSSCSPGKPGRGRGVNYSTTLLILDPHSAFVTCSSDYLNQGEDGVERAGRKGEFIQKPTERKEMRRFRGEWRGGEGCVWERVCRNGVGGPWGGKIN